MKDTSTRSHPTTHSRPRIRAAAVLLCALPVLLASEGAVATQQAPAPVSARHGSVSTPTGDPMVTVEVTAARRPGAAAEVTAALLPRSAPSGARVLDQTLPTLAVTSGPSGAHTVHAPETMGDLARLWRSDGLVDLEIRTESSGRTAYYFLTLDRQGETWVPAAATEQTADPGIAHVLVDLAPGGETELFGSSTATDPLLTTETAATSRVEPYCPVASQKYKSRKLKRKATEKFAVVNTWRGAPGTITQTASSRHTTGSAINYKYKGVGWSTGGTRTLRANDRESQSGLVDKAIYNRLNLRAGRRYCTWIRNRFTYYKRLDAESIHTLIYKVKKMKNPRKRYRYCQAVTKNRRYTKKRGRNRTYRRGVDLGPIRSLAQSGWNSSTRWSVYTKRPSSRCYTSSDGPVRSHAVMYRRK